jgi:very-short-patch-repair endonuclease
MLARMIVSGWPTVFRGSHAVAAGLVTAGRLRGPTFRRVFPDVYVRATTELDLAVRARAAGLLVGERGVVSGYAAAELLGAACAWPDAPAEVTVDGRFRAHVGLVVHQDVLAPDEISSCAGVRVTTGIRTAFDLARRLELVDAVVAVDRLANRCRFDPGLLLHVLVRYPGLRGNAGIPDVLAYADRRSGSVPESRLRMLLTTSGLPRPQVQWPVQDPVARTAIWLDLAYPDALLGIEYEGAHHAEADQVLKDAGRYTRLVARGWRILRYTKHDLAQDRTRIVREVRAALAHRVA